jgi:hypothetical protein
VRLTKIFFWIAPSSANIKSNEASCVRPPNTTPRPPATSTAPRKMVKPLLIPMSLLRAAGSFRCFHPLVIKDYPDHDAQKKKRDISELG